MIFSLILGALIGVIITVLITPLIEPAVTKFYIKIGISKQSIMEKKPKLELFLLDENGEATTELYAKPTFIEIKHIKREEISKLDAGLPFSLLADAANQIVAKQGAALWPFKKIPKDMIPIGIEIDNSGDSPASGITIFLYFPDVCELEEENTLHLRNRNFGGLYIDKDDKKIATAWIEKLGNNLAMKKFDKIYVRFPQESKDYKINATVIQENYPPKEFRFKIHVEPNIEERIKYIDE